MAKRKKILRKTKASKKRKTKKKISKKTKLAKSKKKVKKRKFTKKKPAKKRKLTKKKTPKKRKLAKKKTVKKVKPVKKHKFKRTIEKKSNPILVGNYYLILKDNKGKFTSSYSKAKTYQIYKDKTKIFKKSLQFPKDLKKVKDKSNHIFDVINELKKLERRKKIRKRTKEKKKQVSDLLRKISKAKTEKTRSKHRVKLRQISDDLTDLSEQYLQIGAIRKVVSKKNLFSEGFKADINIKMHNILHDPIRFDAKTMGKVLKELAPRYYRELFRLVSNVKPSQRYIILRLIYRHPLKTGRWVERAVGVKRVKMTSRMKKADLARITKRILNNLLKVSYKKFVKDRESYFTKEVVPPEVDLAGISIEYIDSFQKSYKTEKKLEIRRKQWARRKRKWRNKAEKTKEKIKKGMS